MIGLVLLAALSAADLRQELETFREDEASLKRFYRQTWSAERRARMKRFYTATRQRLAAMDFAKLDGHGRVDYLLFRNQLDYELRTLGLQEKRWEEVAALVPFAGEIVALAEARQRVEPVEPKQAAGTLARLERQVRALGKPEAKSTLRARAAAATWDLRRSLRGWFEFYEGFDPLFTWWVKEPFQKLEAALEARAKKLVEGEENALTGDPVGRAALLSDLAYEMIPYTPEELIEIANREFAWCEKEMLVASHELGFGDNWQKALDQVKGLHAAPGEQTQVVKKLALEAIDYVEKHKLVTVPPLARETWRMEMMSPEQQRVNPFFLGGEEIRVSFPTDGMTHEQKMMSLRGNNVHFARATVFHELIPGHFLQEFTGSRNRPYRAVFATPFWTEGWALYWEMLLYDRGFAATAENRVGMLFWRMHRCARIIFSLRFHLEQMTAQECVNFLVDRVGHERENAVAEVRRSIAGSYPPLYQLAYMMGAIQFRGLRKELVDAGKMTELEFHDGILRLNNIPVAMVRASLLGEALTPEFQPRWRFADR